MTVPASETRPTAAAPGLDPGIDPDFADYLLDSVARTLPATGPDADPACKPRREALRIAFHSMRPRNAMEAMLVAEAISAHHVIMDCFRLAVAPDTDQAAAARSRSNAATLSHVRLATLRALQNLRVQPPPDAPDHAMAGAAEPLCAPQSRQIETDHPAEPEHTNGPTAELSTQSLPARGHPAWYQPRDRYGQPIPLWSYESMTMAQRRAIYYCPANPALEAEAIAEEEAMIAAQAEEDRRRGQRGSSEPDPKP